MKASNKVLTVFFGIILLYISAAFTEVRIRGVKGDLDNENVKVETIPLDDLKYLVVSDLDKRVLLKSSDKPRLEIRSRSEGIISELKYELEGDTLNLQEFDISEDIRFNITLHIPKGFLGISMDKASVHISNISGPSFSINQVGGRLVFDEKVYLDKLEIIASDRADIDGYNFEVDTMILQLDEAEVYMQSPVNSLQGSMTNKSNLVMSSVNDIVFNKDESSELRLFN